jgi:hypothetical protein
MPLFFFGRSNCSCNCNVIYICHEYVLYRVAVMFPQSLFHYQHSFPPLCETLYASHVELFAEVLEFFTRPMCQLVVTKWRPQSVSFREPKRWKLRDAEIGTVGRMRENSPPTVAVASFVHRLLCGLVLLCRMRTRVIFLFGPTLQIHCSNFFNVCKPCSELTVVPRSKNHPESACQPLFGLCCHCRGCLAMAGPISSAFFTTLKILDPASN